MLQNNQGDTALVILKDHGEDIDISNHINVIEINDTSPISAKIILNAARGRFITISPKIKKWDRIYIEITSKNGKKFQTVLHVSIMKKNRKNGLQRILFCPHQSSNRTKSIVSISTPNRRISGHQAVVNAIQQINSDRGIKDPEIILPDTFDVTKKHGSRLNRELSNNYIAEATTFGEFLDEIIKIESNPPEIGGSHEFHFWRIQSLYDHITKQNLDKCVLQIFEQGYQNDGNGTFTSTPNVTLKKTAENDYTGNTLEFDSNEETEQATNIIVIGDNNAGSYPTDYSKFQGAKDAYRLTKLWESNKKYLKGILVRYDSKTYECKQDHTSTSQNPYQDTTNWTVRYFNKPAEWQNNTYYGKFSIVRIDSIAYEALQSHTSSSSNKPVNDSYWIRINFVPTTDYSPLTKGKAQYWINAMGGYVDANTNNGKTAYIDHNSIIKDDKHRRTDVDGVYNNSNSIPDHMKKLIGSTRYPIDGLRILVKGTGLNDFAGDDPNGISFSNSIAVFRDESQKGITGKWYVLEHWGIVKNDDEIYDYEKGDSWTYKPCNGTLNADGTCSAGRKTAWTKGAYLLFDGLGYSSGKFITNGQFDCVHPVKFDSINGHVEVGNEKISEDDTDGNSAVFASFEPSDHDSKKIAGLNWTAMMPRNSNAIPYGPVTIGEKISLSVLDFINKHKTHLGTKEWFGGTVEDYFDLNGWEFFQRIDEYLPLGVKKPTGDYKMQIWAVDENDNKITIEYLQKKNGSVSPMSASISKNAIQHSVPGISTFIRANELEILEIFDFEKVRRGGIETIESFDVDGRFRSALTNANIFDLNRFAFAEKLKISIDALRLTKPLVVTNVDEPNVIPERNIQSKIIKAPKITSYSQAKSLVRNLVPILQFEKDEFPIVKKFSNDVGYGDSIYYTDSEAIDETTDGKPNTIKVVIQNNYISISKGGDDAPGGFRQTVHLITRLWN